MKLYFLLAIVAAVCIQASVSQKQNKRPRHLIVTIPELGKVKGKRVESAWTGKRIFQFVDIKYGETTGGEGRFKAPVPAKPWEGVMSAFSQRRGCPSLQDINRIKKTEVKHDVEDCLSLTVNTKNLSQSNPVMVYIHGEFLYEGSSIEAAPEYLLEKDVVLVAVRYRLAPFGFISTKTKEIPGNAGVLDVILALKWIQKNIQYFGGDPKRVTLFGQVAGAAIANLLTMSPLADETLFHRVIYQSGSAQTPAFITDNPMPYARDIASNLEGCSLESKVEEVNNCLLKANVTNLLAAFSKHGIINADKGIGHYGGIQFTIGGPSGVLPDHPAQLIEDKKIRYVPTMGGSTKNAGSFILKEIFEDNFNEKIPDSKFNGSTYIDYVIAQTNGVDEDGAWKSFALSDFFEKDEISNGTFKIMLPGLIDLCGTIPFKNPLLLAMQANAEKMPNQTFLYSFNYEGQYNRYLSEEEMDDGVLPFELGVTLTDDNLYLFPWPDHGAYLNSRDSKVAKLMVALFTSFATDGNPRGEGLKKFPPMTEATGPYLRIDSTLSIRKSFTYEYTITAREARKGLSLVLEDINLSEDVEDKVETPKVEDNETS